MTLGEKIQFYRKQKNLSQEQLGEMLFVSRQTVSLWEKNQTQPTIDNLLKLKEIFGVTVDVLLSEDAEITQGDNHAAEEPLESFTVTYQEGDIRKGMMGHNKERFIPSVVLLFIELLMLVWALIDKNVQITEITGIILFLFVAFAVFYYFRQKKLIRFSEQQTLNKVFHYDIFENHMILKIYQNGDVISEGKILFSELINIHQYGSIIMFQHSNRLLLVHTTDLSENSSFYRSLRSRFTEINQTKRNSSLTTASVLLLVFAIVYSLIGLLIYASSGDNPFKFLVPLITLPIPVGSVVFGAVTKRKGYSYLENTIIGIWMIVCLIGVLLLIR